MSIGTKQSSNGLSAGDTVLHAELGEGVLLRTEGASMGMEPVPFRDHSDAELAMLEALVGREPPFMKDGKYPAKRY